VRRRDALVAIGVDRDALKARRTHNGGRAVERPTEELIATLTQEADGWRLVREVDGEEDRMDVHPTLEEAARVFVGDLAEWGIDVG
jgi:hypothetical protein